MREHGSKSECPSRQTPIMAEIRPERRCVRMKVLIGVDPEADSEVLRLLSERREDFLVAERTRAFNRLHGLLRDLAFPAGCRGHSRHTEPRASCAQHTAARSLGLCPPAVGFGDPALSVRALERKIA